MKLVPNASTRYCYPKPTDVPDTTDTLQGIRDVPDRIDNISDTALRIFCEHYPDDTITKDAIFDYVYGVLHAPSYREMFANDLSKEIPRIPFAPDFHAFAEAGKGTCSTPPRLRDVRTVPAFPRVRSRRRTATALFSVD